MKKSNTILIGSSLFLIAVAFVVFYYLRAKDLQESLSLKEDTIEKMRYREETIQKLLSIDSLLLQGDYQSAYDAYVAQQGQGSDDTLDSPMLRLRINMVQRLIDRQSSTEAGPEQTEDSVKIDSVIRSRMALPVEVQRYDSLNFALEKAKVQAENLKRQLKLKSSSEYLTFTSSKGTKVFYIGQIKNKKANGKGMALLSTGSRYEGEWKNNMRYGKGIFYWPDGQYYKGYYKDDKRHGEGTYYWPNGEKYIGDWKNDQRNGQGVFYAKDGKITASGTWKDDKLAEVASKKQD